MVVVGTRMKWCWRCDEVKPLSGFRLTKPGGGYRGRCNACEWADRRRKTSMAAAIREAAEREGVPDGSKRCLSCGVVLGLAMFPDRNGPGSTKRNQCRSCVNKKRRANVVSNPRPHVPAYLPSLDEIMDRSLAIRACAMERPTSGVDPNPVGKAILDYGRAWRSIRELLRSVP